MTTPEHAHKLADELETARAKAKPGEWRAELCAAARNAASPSEWWPDGPSMITSHLGWILRTEWVGERWLEDRQFIVHAANAALALVAALRELVAENERQRAALKAVLEASRALFGSPNWENRLGPWKDINEAVFTMNHAVAAAEKLLEGKP